MTRNHEAALHCMFHSAVRRAYQRPFLLVAWRRNYSRIWTVGTDATKARPGVFSHYRELRAQKILCLVKVSHVSCGEIFVFE
jgi:hypothetical protein